MVITTQTDNLYVRNTAYSRNNVMDCVNTVDEQDYPITQFTYNNTQTGRGLFKLRAYGFNQSGNIYEGQFGYSEFFDSNDNWFFSHATSYSTSSFGQPYLFIRDSHTDSNDWYLFTAQGSWADPSFPYGASVAFGGFDFNGIFRTNIYGSCGWLDRGTSAYVMMLDDSPYSTGRLFMNRQLSMEGPGANVLTSFINSSGYYPSTSTVSLNAPTVIVDGDLTVYGELDAEGFVVPPVTSENFYQNSAGTSTPIPSTKDAGYVSIYSAASDPTQTRSAGLFFRPWASPTPFFALFDDVLGSLRGSSTVTGYRKGNLVVSQLSGSQAEFESNVEVQGTVHVARHIEAPGIMTLAASEVEVDDPSIKLAADNVLNVTDAGVYAQYKTDATRYSGLIHKASDDKFHVFTNTTAEPTTVLNTSAASYTRADVLLSTINANGAISAGAGSAISCADGVGEAATMNADGTLTVSVLTPTAADQLTTKSYVDAAVAAGASNFRPAGQWFVAPNGVDDIASNDGSPGKPWATVQYAVTRIELQLVGTEKAILNVAAGTYAGNVTISKNISVYGVPGTTPSTINTPAVALQGDITFFADNGVLESTLCWVGVNGTIQRTGDVNAGSVWLTISQCLVSALVQDNVINMPHSLLLNGRLTLEQSVVRNYAYATTSYLINAPNVSTRISQSQLSGTYPGLLNLSSSNTAPCVIEQSSIVHYMAADAVGGGAVYWTPPANTSLRITDSLIQSDKAAVVQDVNANNTALVLQNNFFDANRVYNTPTPAAIVNVGTSIANVSLTAPNTSVESLIDPTNTSVTDDGNTLGAIITNAASTFTGDYLYVKVDDAEYAVELYA